jgi:DNA-binding FadR family transcriptional regulator
MASLQGTAPGGPLGLHEEAASRLRGLIICGDLQPGEQLIETDLCEALGVSRTPLHEALKLLVAEGLVQLWLNRSAIVTPIRVRRSTSSSRRWRHLRPSHHQSGGQLADQAPTGHGVFRTTWYADEKICSIGG